MKRNLENISLKKVGFLPLFFFGLTCFREIHEKTPDNIFWMCHLSFLLLAIGLFFERATLIRVAAGAIIVGIPFFFLDLVVGEEKSLISLVFHLAGLGIAFFSLWRVGVRQGLWMACMLWYFFTQLLSRLFTHPSFNVNVAFQIYSDAALGFKNYWSYWLFVSFLGALMFWCLEKMWMRIFPNRVEFVPATMAVPDSDRFKGEEAFQNGKG